MTPFSIQCTTCRRSLRVVDPAAIGQILACPKCGSMVLIEVPAAGVPGGAASNGATTVTAGSIGSGGGVRKSGPAPVESLTSSSVIGPGLISPGSLVTKTGGAAENSSTPVSGRPSTVNSAAAIAPPASSVGSRAADSVPSAPPTTAAEISTTPSQPWPWWFLPSAATVVAIAAIVFTLRAFLHTSDEPPAAPSGTTSTQAEPERECTGSCVR